MSATAETELSVAAPSRDGLHGPSPLSIGHFLDVANALTLTGLAAAVACSLLAVNGLLAYAVVALMCSGLCDLFDGFVARRLNRSSQQRRFGGHLDSVVDACSFGFAPVVLMYASGLHSAAEILLLFFFAACVVWRLAYFDTVGLQGDGRRRYFRGLPTTYVALVLPLAFLAGFLGKAWLRGSVGIAMVGLALAMISTFPVRKPGGVCYLLFPVCGVALTAVFVTLAGQFIK